MKCISVFGDKSIRELTNPSDINQWLNAYIQKIAHQLIIKPHWYPYHIITRDEIEVQAHQLLLGELNEKHIN